MPMMMMTMVERSWVGALKCNGAQQLLLPVDYSPPLILIINITVVITINTIMMAVIIIIVIIIIILVSSDNGSLCYIIMRYCRSTYSTFSTFTSAALITTTQVQKKFQLWYVGAPQDVLVYFLGPNTWLKICCYDGYLPFDSSSNALVLHKSRCKSIYWDNPLICIIVSICYPFILWYAISNRWDFWTMEYFVYILISIIIYYHQHLQILHLFSTSSSSSPSSRCIRILLRYVNLFLF